MSTDLACTSGPLDPHAPHPGETPAAHLEFLLWAYHSGPLRDELATAHSWAVRAQQIAAQQLVAGDPAEQMREASIKRVETVFLEMSKLHQRVLQSPENVLAPGEVLLGLEKLTDTIQGLQERNAAMQDYSVLTPEDREIMLAAERIQREILGA